MKKDIVDVVRSPYFCTSPRIEDTKEAPKEKLKVVVSPYFNHNYGPGIEIEIAQKNKGKARVVSPFFQNGSENKMSEDKGKGKAKVVVVSPYFEHHNYNNGNYKVVVKEKAINKGHLVLQPHAQQGGNPSSSSPYTASREGVCERGGNGNGKGRRVRFNPLLEAYRRKITDNYWIPPKSIYRLLQERYYEDPWKVLVICMLLNRTTGGQARRVIFNLFNLCPDANAATKVETKEIEKIIRSLGLQKKRSNMIQRFSHEYLSNKWTHVTQLHGIGKYAADAYAIFCTGHWKEVQPDDHKLVPYWKYLWESEMS